VEKIVNKPWRENLDQKFDRIFGTGNAESSI
jgi:hypothetical protein